MPTDTSTLRGAIVTAVEALSGWTVSRFAPDLYGRDADQLVHHGFSVSIPDTAPVSREARQRVSEGLLVQSIVEIRWAHRLRADAQSDDYDDALNVEQDLIGAVRGIAAHHVLVTRVTRRADPAGWVLGVATFTAVHRYALA